MNFYSSPRADVINLYIASKSGFKDEIRRERSYRHLVIIDDGTRRYDEGLEGCDRREKREKREIVLVDSPRFQDDATNANLTFPFARKKRRR